MKNKSILIFVEFSLRAENGRIENMRILKLFHKIVIFFVVVPSNFFFKWNFFISYDHNIV